MDQSISEIQEEEVTFESIGVCEELLLSCKRLNYNTPTSIQAKAIPYALSGNDVIGLATTGSGKTATFALPILQSLLQSPQEIYALVLTPTRELAMQISDTFMGLGAFIGLRTVVLVGGLDPMEQAIKLSQKPHIIIGTPGRVADHLQNTKGFTIQSIKYLVLDEADRLLNMDFEKEINLIVQNAPNNRQTFLFSATMTSQVLKLQRACLKRDAIKVEVASKYQTVETLSQKYIFLPAKFKDAYIIYLLQQYQSSAIIIFCDTADNASKLTLLLEKFDFKAVALYGKLSQQKRMESLNKFRSRGRNVLVATDVASRGLDIPQVDLVVNYDIPQASKNYIHRVGRTARAGRSGQAISLVTQYDVQHFQRIEQLIKVRMEQFELDKDQVMSLNEEVEQVRRRVSKMIEERELEEDAEDAVDSEGFRIQTKVRKRKRPMPQSAIKRQQLKKKLRR